MATRQRFSEIVAGSKTLTEKSLRLKIKSDEIIDQSTQQQNTGTPKIPNTAAPKKLNECLCTKPHHQTGLGPETNDNGKAAEILNSWKEIAQYLSRGVRTVQRWECDLQLPVRRPRQKSRSAVIAFKSELDLWLLRSSPNCPAIMADDDPHLALQRLEHRLEQLRAEMHIVQGQISKIKRRLPETLEVPNPVSPRHRQHELVFKERELYPDFPIPFPRPSV